VDIEGTWEIAPVGRLADAIHNMAADLVKGKRVEKVKLDALDHRMTGKSRE
jgi:hypothetical protein